MNKISTFFFLLSLVLSFSSCVKNRDVSASDGPNFREIHEDIHFHFDRVAVDGNQYLILERDRNNPHEGFGFMALDGTDILANQDSIKAYLKTLIELQVQQMSQSGDENVSKNVQRLLKSNLDNSTSPYYVNGNKTKSAED